MKLRIQETPREISGLLYNKNKLNIVNRNDINVLNLPPEGDRDGIILSEGLKI